MGARILPTVSNSSPGASEAFPRAPSPAPIRKPTGVWIIFEEPTGGYSAQRFYLGEFVRLTAAPKLIGSTIENVRALLPEGLTKMGPFEQAEPFVVEWWA